MAPRRLAYLFLRHPEHLEKQELQMLSHSSQEFLQMVRKLEGERLEAWLTTRSSNSSASPMAWNETKPLSS